MTELKCTHCNRYIGKAESIVGTLLCPSCKGETQYKIISNKLEELYFYKFADKPKMPKKETKDNE